MLNRFFKNYHSDQPDKNDPQAYECGLVTEVIDEENFEDEAMAQVKELSNLAIRSMEVSKALVQGRDLRTIAYPFMDQVE